MDKNTVYILQKDLPDVKAGTVFTCGPKLQIYSPQKGYPEIEYAMYSYSKKFVENNPEWFKPKEEPQWEIQCLVVGDENYWIQKSGKYKCRLFQQEYNLDVVMSWYSFKNIHSVKRFPDNTVWSVGDMTGNGIIDGFKIIREDELDSGVAAALGIIENVGKMAVTINNHVPNFLLDNLSKPKETPKPEWEILDYSHDNRASGLHSSEGECGCPIKTVKRLSDGEVFSVGDYVNRIGDAGTIHGFEVKEVWSGGIRVYFDTGKIMGTAISEIQKVNPKTAPKEEQVVKLYTESELLQACRDAFSSGYTRGWHNGCFEEDKTLSKKITDKKFEDYINSLK